MRLSEFIVLTEDQKCSIVFREGVALAQRDLRDYTVFLFQLPSYYVELYCDKQSRKVFEFKVFHSPGHLTPYLDAIPLDGLLND